MAKQSMLPRAIVLVCAGIGTFYAAAQWSRSQRDGHGDDSTVVQPAPRPASPVLAFAPASTGTGSATVAASSAAPQAAPDEASGDPTLSLATRKRSVSESHGDAFASLSWQPPPPPPPPPPPKAVPAPPPPPVFPFTFVGMLEQGGKGKPSAFLSHGETLLVVSAGDLIENRSYRVDSLTPNEVVLTQLATNQQHTINVSWGAK